MTNSEKPNAGHQLYYFATCPYCIKVLATLKWLGIKIELKDILFHPKNKSELIAGGGKKQVPCLRVEDKHGKIQWMYESSEIIRYFKEEFTVA